MDTKIQIKQLLWIQKIFLLNVTVKKFCTANLKIYNRIGLINNSFRVINGVENFMIRYLGAPNFSYAVGIFEVTVEENFKILTNEKPQNFSISLPKENFTETALKNFKLILESKANLIKSAIGIEKVDFEISADKLNFNRFDETPSAEEIQAYSNFICKVGELAKKQKRVTARRRIQDDTQNST